MLSGYALGRLFPFFTTICPSSEVFYPLCPLVAFKKRVLQLLVEHSSAVYDFTCASTLTRRDFGPLKCYSVCCLMIAIVNVVVAIVSEE